MRPQVWLASAATLLAAVAALDGDYKDDWTPYASPLKIPSVIDMTKGGTLDMQIGQTTHNWTTDATNGVVQAQMYGYGLLNGTVSFPGPTIKVTKDVPIIVTWHNKLTVPHLLDENVEETLLLDQSSCYPNCGIPLSVHVHGLEVPAKYDGVPKHSFYSNQSRTNIYGNTQSASTKLYHDHAAGITRLNIWAGMMGMYIIEDKPAYEKLNLVFETDIPLFIADRLIGKDGKLMYTDQNCNAAETKWISEAWGTINTVNGVVMPYLNVPPAQVRFRLVNVANARLYNITLPFADKCQIIAHDSGLVVKPESVPVPWEIFPFQRSELVCDFSDVKNGTTFEITDEQSNADVQETKYDPKVMLVRVVDSLKTDKMVKKEIPATLGKLKDLRTLFKETGGKTRSLMLGEVASPEACPLHNLVRYRNQEINATLPMMGKLQCTRGKVEMWNFKNPTDDPHPFHWHLVNAQCGPTEAEIDTNALRDVVVIPNAVDRPVTDVTQVCYVACTPDQFLIEDATRKANDYGFDTSEPYVAHCHILEHEENMMMAFFKLTDEDDDAPWDDGYVNVTGILTNEVIYTGMGMSILGGLAFCVSVVIISVDSLKFLASAKSLSFAFALSAGVMLFISLGELFPEAIVFYRAAFTIGEINPEAYESGADPGSGVCDVTCVGHAWLAAVVALFVGALIIHITEYIVHTVFDHHNEPIPTGADMERGVHSHDHQLQSPVTGAPGSYHKSEELQSPETAEKAMLVEGDAAAEKAQMRRAGILTGIAIGIHNIPEGIALFVACLGGLRSGIFLSLGIILHNVPEGVAVAAPVYYATGSKWEALKWTLFGAVALPIGAAIGWAFVSQGLNFFLEASLYGVVGGMLLCITIKELLPGAYKFDPHGSTPVIGFFAGIAIMGSGLIILHYSGTG